MRCGHQHGTSRVGPNATEQTCGTFVAGHLDQSVEGMSVVTALLYGESCVGLHAHVHNVGRVSCDTAKEAGCTGHPDQGEGAGGSIGRCEARFQLFIYTEASGGIRYLSQERGRKLHDCCTVSKRSLSLSLSFPPVSPGTHTD